MRTHILCALLLFSGCSFAKEPYLFTSLADVDLSFDGTVVARPDAAGTDAAPADDAAPGDDALVDGGETTIDAEVDAGGPPDTGILPPTVAVRAVAFSDNRDVLVGDHGRGLPVGGSARTVEAWVRVPLGVSTTVVRYGGVARPYFAVQLDHAANNAATLYVSDGFIRVASTPILNFNDTSWHHVAVTVTATQAPGNTVQIAFYADGDLISNANGIVLMDPTADETTQVLSGGFDSGELDELRVWSVVHTRQEINTFRFGPLGVGTFGLAARWAMDAEGAGPGIEVPNAVATSTHAPPALRTTGNPSFVRSTAF